jgi:hypothetical protein
MAHYTTHSAPEIRTLGLLLRFSLASASCTASSARVSPATAEELLTCEDRGDGWVLDDVVERELVGGLREAPDELEHLAAVPYPRPLWPTLTTARCLATPSIVGRTGGARAGSPTAVAMA